MHDFNGAERALRDADHATHAAVGRRLGIGHLSGHSDGIGRAEVRANAATRAILLKKLPLPVHYAPSFVSRIRFKADTAPQASTANRIGQQT